MKFTRSTLLMLYINLIIFSIPLILSFIAIGFEEPHLFYRFIAGKGLVEFPETITEDMPRVSIVSLEYLQLSSEEVLITMNVTVSINDDGTTLILRDIYGWIELQGSEDHGRILLLDAPIVFNGPGNVSKTIYILVKWSRDSLDRVIMGEPFNVYMFVEYSINDRGLLAFIEIPLNR